MRALRLNEEMSPERVMKACLEEMEAWRKERSSTSGAVLVVQVREILDAPIENGAEPQRKAQPR